MVEIVPSNQRLFLCYASEDAVRVSALYDKLRKDGFGPWMDKRDILPGEQWDVRLFRVIRDAACFLCCFSNTFVKKRGTLQREVSDALKVWEEKLEDDIYFIPVRLEDCPVPDRLRRFQWVNLFEADGYHRLRTAIHRAREQRTSELGASSAGAVESVRICETVTEPIPYIVDVEFPRLVGSPNLTDLNGSLAGLAAEKLLGFRGGTLSWRYSEEELRDLKDLSSSLPSSFAISYAMHLFTDDLLSVEFQVFRYGAGAAHPNHWTETKTYCLRPVVELGTGDLFQPGSPWMKKLSEFSEGHLREVLVLEESGGQGADWIAEGTREKPDAFKKYVLTKDALVLYFDEYEVGPYSMGRQVVPIPYGELGSLFVRGGPLGALV